MTTKSTLRALLATSAMLPVLALLSGQAVAEVSFTPAPSPDGYYIYDAKLSADGSTIIGQTNAGLFIWTASTGYSYKDIYLDESNTVVSADGSVVAGSAYVSGVGNQAFVLSNDQMTYLGTLSGGSYSYANDISADGTVVVGQSNYSVDGVSGQHAFRWTSEGMVDLGSLLTDSGLNYDYSYAYAVSADGSAVVGQSNTDDENTHAFRWTGDLGMADLGTLGGTYSYAVDVSNDGSVVVGTAYTEGNSNHHAFRWTEAGGMADLGTLGGTYSSANQVSGDGSVVIGQAYTADNNNYVGFRWSDGEMQAVQLEGSTYSYLRGLSYNGSVVVGQSNLNDGNLAIRWSEATGTQTVVDWIVDQGGAVAEGYELTDAFGVSADGKIIAGRGIYEDKNTLWLARESTPVVEPTTPAATPTTATPQPSTPTVDFMPDTEDFNKTLIAVGASVASGSLDTGSLAVNGAHHRTLLDMGLKASASGWFAWTTGDAAKNNYTDTTMSFGEIGLGRDIGATRVGVAFGTSSTTQDWANGGSGKFNGDYVLAEVDHAFDLAGDSALHASLLGYSAKFSTKLNRSYASGLGIDTSTGTPDMTASAVKAKLDWVNAAKIGAATVSPYAALTLSKAKVDGYSETGGAFDATYNATTATSNDLRIGSAFAFKPTEQLSLRVGVEAVHQFDAGTDVISGDVTGLYGFNLASGKQTSNWARVTVDADYALTSATSLSGGLSMATQGSQASIGVTLGLRAAF
jgi:probable HAF family extracellular repeat protein